MAKKSAGILLYRVQHGFPEIFLVHPGGPFYIKKDLGYWSIPKGEFSDEEDPLHAAEREFMEETGTQLKGDFIELSPIRQKSGKIVLAWAHEGNIDEMQLKCNNFQLEWPPKSGKMQEFAEVDRGEWFTVEEAKKKINPKQAELIEELMRVVNRES